MKWRQFPLFAVMGRRLFFKIFLAFWIAMTLAGIGLLRVENARTAELAQRFRGVAGDALAVYAASAAQNYQSQSASETTLLKDFLDDLEDRTSIRAWLYDSRDTELSGYAFQERRKQPNWMRVRMSQLIRQARVSGNSEFADLDGATLAAHSVTTDDHQIYVLAGILPDARYDFWGASSQVQMLRFFSILLVAGAVSGILAHHLTQPLEELRALAQRLTTGDFSARAFLGFDRRRDELAELAGDFNGMAEQIESLLHEKEKLLAAQRHLLGDVAHELRSPLTRATVALELARDALGVNSDEENFAGAETLPSENIATRNVTDSLNRIERETGNLSELIDRLLMLSRLESGVQKPERAPVDLAVMVRAIAADADFEARSRNRLVKVTRCEVCHTLGTTALLRSAIENVVRNAIRHTPENTAVEVELTCEDDGENWEDEQDSFTSEAHSSEEKREARSWATVTIRDQGAGVPTAELSEIFRPFYRAGSGRARQSGGAGLGLTITARAMELHGGQYRLSNLPGEGLQVQLRFATIRERGIIQDTMQQPSTS